MLRFCFGWQENEARSDKSRKGRRRKKVDFGNLVEHSRVVKYWPPKNSKVMKLFSRHSFDFFTYRWMELPPACRFAHALTPRSYLCDHWDGSIFRNAGHLWAFPFFTIAVETWVNWLTFWLLQLDKLIIPQQSSSRFQTRSRFVSHMAVLMHALLRALQAHSTTGRTVSTRMLSSATVAMWDPTRVWIWIYHGTTASARLVVSTCYRRCWGYKMLLQWWCKFIHRRHGLCFCTGPHRCVLSITSAAHD